jgi:hypothetical protein
MNNNPIETLPVGNVTTIEFIDRLTMWKKINLGKDRCKYSNGDDMNRL